jgi:uncharacterized NAD-dependent epimerase/dehydratase family protein
LIQLRQPYVLFLGDAPDQLAAKTADGIARWRPDLCVGQLRLPDCKADIGLPDMTLEKARAAGAQTLIAGVANRGGIVSEAWRDTLLQAVALGFDIASGLHGRLSAIPGLEERALKQGTQLHDVRYSDQHFPIASGAKRSGKRLLTVGTDCSVGKMFTALAIEREMQTRGVKATFRASGQTGIFIAGEGLCVDAIISDFIAGAAEVLSPNNDADHWDLVEGQGSLFHASYAGVSLGLLHGSQPDALVLCHDPDRDHMRGLPTYGLPAIDACIRLNESCGSLTNPACRTVGIAVNTSKRSQEHAFNLLETLEQQTGLPCVDPMRQGAGRLVDALPL